MIKIYPNEGQDLIFQIDYSTDGELKNQMKVEIY